MATARKLIGDDYAEDRNRERKGDIAAAMERAFAEAASETEGFDAATVAKTTRWLPDGMVFAGATELVPTRQALRRRPRREICPPKIL